MLDFRNLYGLREVARTIPLVLHGCDVVAAILVEGAPMLLRLSQLRLPHVHH